jgi:hypothetical protein
LQRTKKSGDIVLETLARGLGANPGALPLWSKYLPLFSKRWYALGSVLLLLHNSLYR